MIFRFSLIVLFCGALIAGTSGGCRVEITL